MEFHSREGRTPTGQDRVVRFGRTVLPEEQEAALRRANKFEWLTIAYYVGDATVLYLVLGNSQTMKTAWIQDLLAFLPPIAFLIAAHLIRRPPTQRHPYGFHRAVGIAHLAAAFALLVVGLYLIGDSGLALLRVEHPSIGAIELFGQVFWLGWLMIGALILTGSVPVYLGMVKMKLAKSLHDRVLYADADMNKADWMTSAAAIVGIIGVGVGLWWADGVAALVISLAVLRDGIRNLRGAVGALIDTRAMTYDDKREDPISDELDDYLRGLSWVDEAKSRVRDEGHVYHIESFVVPQRGRMPSLEELERARNRCIKMD